MKKLILGMALLVSTGAFAATEAIVFPQVINFGSQVQVQIFNNTPQTVMCNGPITIVYRSGRQDYANFFQTVWPHQNFFRTIYTNPGDWIAFVNHGIFCH